MKLESANVAARKKVDTNSDGTTSAGKTTTCTGKEEERGHLTNMTAMTPEDDAKRKRDQTYRIELKKNHTQSTLLHTRILQKKDDSKKGYTGAAQVNCMHHNSTGRSSDEAF